MTMTKEVNATSASRKRPPKPSEALINSVHRLLAAVAHERHIRPIVEAYQKPILEKHKWAAVKDKPQSSCHTLGAPSQADLLGNDPLWALITELNEARVAAGLTVRRPDDCPLVEAARNLVYAEAYVVEDLGCYEGPARHGADAYISKMQFEHVNPGVVLRKHRVARALDLVAPFLSEAERTVIHGLRADA